MTENGHASLSRLKRHAKINKNCWRMGCSYDDSKLAEQNSEQILVDFSEVMVVYHILAYKLYSINGTKKDF